MAAGRCRCCCRCNNRQPTRSPARRWRRARPGFGRCSTRRSTPSSRSITRAAITEFNASAERIFGYARDDVIGRQMVELLVPPRLREAHVAGLQHYLATGEGPVLGRRIEVPAVRADGSEFPIELSIVRAEMPGPPVFTAYARDISERVLRDATLQESSAIIALVVRRDRQPHTRRHRHELECRGRTDLRLHGGGDDRPLDRHPGAPRADGRARLAQREAAAVGTRSRRSRRFGFARTAFGSTSRPRSRGSSTPRAS